MNPYLWLAGLLFVLACSAGSYRIGVKVERSEWLAKKVEVQEKIIYRDRVIEKEVPKIVTRVVEKRVEVEKEVERVVTVIPKVLAPDCVLPDGFGLLLASAANGIDPTAPGGASTFAGTYDCREVLAAVLTDLEAGWVNSQRLQGLQQWVELVTKESPSR